MSTFVRALKSFGYVMTAVISFVGTIVFFVTAVLFMSGRSDWWVPCIIIVITLFFWCLLSAFSSNTPRKNYDDE